MLGVAMKSSMLSVIILSIIMMSVVMLCDIMLIIVMLSAIMLIVIYAECLCQDIMKSVRIMTLCIMSKSIKHNSIKTLP